MRRVQYRRWCPRESPLQIEIPEDLLRELRPVAGTLETQGLLYGLRHGKEIRILRTKPETGETALGMFVCRERGEVFLTESNLGLLEQQGLAMVLVIAGHRAGFFVREADGTILTVRSHEEFPVAEELRVEPVARTLPGLKPAQDHMHKWNWALAGWMALVALPVAALAYLRPAFPQKPLTPTLQVREDDGQLHIQWHGGGQAILDIEDGDTHTSVPVSANQSSATYERRSGEVEISLIRLDGPAARREGTRFVGTPPPAAPMDVLYSDLTHIRARADRMRAESAEQRARIAALQTEIGKRIAQ